MENEDRLIYADALKKALRTNEGADAVGHSIVKLLKIDKIVDTQPTVDAVVVSDKELLNAINLLIKQYEHSRNSDYVHHPIAHAFFHTWRQLDKRRE